ncbi:alcohol dehydrogenase [Saccharospirillum sp. MSK14-1]|uniref:zinc-binding dehydrogenase n=1 Tax=Saccharospirillum sp. MSK14-1 TaxID=1897632 RepID=UPI000D390E28|nr:zinc-binding dehydrogenase [Saccharospirillum sp. MSK14-1]PTY37629.1 alcohol dehydrogenase [Saccharospirillum sp. MSK14-1]
MKAITYTTFGTPVDVLSVTDTATPEPAAGAVRVRMTASPIHNHDLWTIRGSYGYKPELPATAGSEAAGVVEAVGAGVDDTLIGQRVAVAGVAGAWAEQFVAPAVGLVPLPDAVSDDVGSQLLAMPLSALALLEQLPLQAGDWLVQTAANGTVGKLMIGMARERGIKVLNLVRRVEAKTELEAFGVDAVLSTEEDDWKTQAEAIVGEAGARAAIDSVGGPIVADVADLLGRDGELIVFGTAAGVPLALNAGNMISRHLTVKGFWGARVMAEMSTEDKVRLIGELVQLAVAGKLHLPSGGDFRLDQYQAAIDASLTAGRSGKILFKP